MPTNSIQVVRGFHCGRRKLDAAADLLAQIARDVPAHQRAHRPTDRPVTDRFSDVGELGIEPLRIADGEFELALARRGDELIGFGKGQRKRFFEEYVLAGGETLARHRIVRRFRSGRDDQRFNLRVGDQLPIVGHRRAGAGRARHLGEPLGANLRQVQTADQRTRRAGPRADTAAPARADDADADLPHARISCWALPEGPATCPVHPRDACLLEHRGWSGTNRDLLC